jgi:hypothetical protein
MFNLYSANHKVWDHVGNITPNVEYSEAHRPHGEFMPAAWLPIGRLDKHYENYFVVSSGKIVALDREGRVVPAGLKTGFAVTSGDVLTYTTTDATEKTIDLGTGVAVVALGSGYTRAELTAALIGRGLLDAGENAEDFISFPVGVAPYNYLQWAGGDGFNPAELKQHNHQMQHRVAILCKYVVEMPLVPASHSGIDLASSTAISDSAIADWTAAGSDGAWFSATSLSLTVRYASDVSVGDNVVALNLPVMDLAKSTTLAPIVLPTGFTREVSSIAEIVQAGDYFIDYDVGVVLVFETDGDAAPVASGTLTFYHYESLPATVSTYACALGDLKPGDFVRANADSNFIKAQTIIDTDVETVTSEDPETSLSSDELAGLLNLCGKRQDEIIGQVLDSDTHPKDYLDRVRTAYPQLGTLDQMPGSASSGLPAQLTYAGGSNKMVRILLLR